MLYSMCRHIHTPASTLTHIYTHIHAGRHARRQARKHTHTHTHARTHAGKQAGTLTGMMRRACIFSCSVPLRLRTCGGESVCVCDVRMCKAWLLVSDIPTRHNCLLQQGAAAAAAPPRFAPSTTWGQVSGRCVHLELSMTSQTPAPPVHHDWCCCSDCCCFRGPGSRELGRTHLQVQFVKRHEAQRQATHEPSHGHQPYADAQVRPEHPWRQLVPVFPVQAPEQNWQGKICCSCLLLEWLQPLDSHADQTMH